MFRLTAPRQPDRLHDTNRLEFHASVVASVLTVTAPASVPDVSDSAMVTVTVTLTLALHLRDAATVHDTLILYDLSLSNR